MKETLIDKVPPSALDYCHQLWLEFPFDFKLSKSRSSKLGDYRFDPRIKSHTVTLNLDLNPYQFLITYVHEVAHRVVHKAGGRQKPHGIEWKTCFQRLMLPLLRPEVFPDDILRALAKHMKNPKASSAADPALMGVLSKYDETHTSGHVLKDLQLDTAFSFRKRIFKKLQEKRTRAVCLELKTGRRYLIPMVAEVEIVD